jgi:hypothetical protein
MDFSFALTLDVAIFLLAFVLFGGWQIAKLIKPSWFSPLDEEQKKKVASIIMTVNAFVAVTAGILFAAFGLTDNFFAVLTNIFAVFSASSFFELFKAYNVVK